MKVFLLGLDGMTLDIVQPYIKAGLLPNFKRILDEGSYGILRSTIPPLSGPAWLSMTTGKNPGKHGLFEFRKKNDYKTEIVTKNTSVHAEPIWKILSRNNRRVSILNVPFTYPPDKTNGMMISGLMTPSEDTEFTYPKTIKDELFKLIPDYKLDIKTRILFSRDKEKCLKEIFKHTKDVRTFMDRYSMDKSWDLSFVVYVGSDRLQHLLWDEIISMDPTCVQYYQLLDDILGDILSGLDDETVLFVVSDHGFSRVNKVFYITTFLNQIGLLDLRERRGISKLIDKVDFSSKFMDKLIGLVATITAPSKVKKSLPSWLLKRILKVLPDPQGNTNWSKTKLFVTLGHGIVFVNLKGRESLGIVEKEDYDKLCRQVEQKMLELKDPDTGENVVEAVLMGDEIYSSEYSNSMPDLVVVMKDGYSIHTAVGKDVLSRKTLRGRQVTSEHHKNGLLMAFGSNIERKRLDAEIYDIAPTILYLMGVPIPEDVDGRVLTEIISPDFVNKNEVKFEKIVKSGFSESGILSDEESEAITKQLKDLGYLS